ncbi:phytanoyl-CoA dioxygenase family protein [Zhongshania aquimaris]|uniref:Phytanoyl-CoA dioxygenase family protein n=1 Tax=Zhongshania aquimaris TaxID=2857107 RepID=A0ABS6VVT7_9GAMM|nr:phytanoyl-CoA dioxygenase family protein [Zhongshania aquimaris]MBW2941756.1 phytanoyl-CoA dioxygenase family protein [Zhongshania aquimaris]
MNPIEQYEKFGYAVLKGFFDKEEVASLAKHVDRIYEKWFSVNEAEIIASKLVNMHSLTSPEYFFDAPDLRKEFFEIIASVKLTKALEDMFGEGIHFHNTQLFFNPLNRKSKPSWHRDMQYSPIEDSVQCDEQNNMLSLHVRIPLIEEKGIELVTGTHKRWDTNLEREVRFELNGHKNSDSLPNSKLIELSLGDVLIFNAQMIHRGNYELNPKRKAFDLCVGKFHPLASSFLDSRVLPTADETNKIKNNQWYTLAREITVNKLS